MLKAEPDGRSARVSLSAFQLVSFFFLCFLYAAARFLHEASPIWRLTSLVWTVAVIGLTLLSLHLVCSQSTVHGPQSTVHGPQSTVSISAFQHFSVSAFPSTGVSDFVFPICFFLVAVPWPSGLEGILVQSLTRVNVRTTTELLALFGVPAALHGNVIEVSTGMVGIDEACSGIRSFQATLMIALFMGELYRLTLSRRLWLVGSGFVLAFVFNVGRTLLLTGVAASKGIAAIASWHDPAGVTILVACFVLIWVFAIWLKRGMSPNRKVAACYPSNTFCGPIKGEMKTDEKAETLTQESRKQKAEIVKREGFSFSAFQYFSVFLIVWLILVEGGTELWYRSHERASVENAGWSVQCPDPSSGYQSVTIPAGIRSQFHSDESTQLAWRDAGGNFWQLYYFRWLPAHALNKRVAALLAKTHGPETCLPAVGMSLKADLGFTTVAIAGMELGLHHYVFSANGVPLHVFYAIYEDQSGSTQMANRRTDNASRVAAALAGSRNYGQRWIEVAVAGYERPEDAQAALMRELGKVIKSGA